MARIRQIIETITCDLCGKEVEAATTVRLGWGTEQWDLDLCPDDNAAISSTFNGWTEKGRRVRPGAGRGTARTGAANDDWTYLESLGFKRHRGRKTAEEQAALARR